MTITCPVCGKRLTGPPAEWPAFPFCSKKCRLVDLGRWLSGDYRVIDPEDQRLDSPAEELP
jgi:endogenous inhibitor of DNA gyrase (YacG/DUF329 family)